MQDLVTASTERISVCTVRALAQYALRCIAVALSTSQPFCYPIHPLSINIHLQPFPTLHFIFPSRSPTYIVYLLGFIFLAQFPRGSNKVLEGCFPLRVLVLVFVDRSRCILQIGPPTNHSQTPSNSTPSFSHPIT